LGNETSPGDSLHTVNGVFQAPFSDAGRPGHGPNKHQEILMTRHSIVLLAALMSAGAFAQTAASTVQRDINQDKRIEAGLQNGSITTREAALLERDEAKVDKMQAQALKDGKLTDAERDRLRAAQNKASRDIETAKTNGVNGNPLSASSQRAQADVQRNINQQQRVENGIKDGSLTNHEVSKLERGQARVDRKEYVAGRDGHIGAREQARIQRSENRQSKRIHHERHDAQERKG
jgi:hypothetical protein